MDPETEKRIDNIIVETSSKLEAIVQEMNTIKLSELDDVTKRAKTNSLRIEFESVLTEQQRRVEEIMREN